MLPFLVHSLGRSLLRLSFLPPFWRLPVMLAAGALVGLGLATTHISRATSYLGDDPETCVNCHVMQTAYATWQRSSHAGVATCNDCHVPHDTLLHKYTFKARDGLRHSAMFTLRLEPQVIHASEAAIPVIESNCRRCHQEVVHAVSIASPAPADDNRRCWDCHREVPHGTTRSLSATPRVMSVQLPSPTSVDQQPTIGGRTPRPESSEPSHDQ